MNKVLDFLLDFGLRIYGYEPFPLLEKKDNEFYDGIGRRRSVEIMGKPIKIEYNNNHFSRDCFVDRKTLAARKELTLLNLRGMKINAFYIDKKSIVEIEEGKYSAIIYALKEEEEKMDEILSTNVLSATA